MMRLIGLAAAVVPIAPVQYQHALIVDKMAYGADRTAIWQSAAASGGPLPSASCR